MYVMKNEKMDFYCWFLNWFYLKYYDGKAQIKYKKISLIYTIFKFSLQCVFLWLDSFKYPIDI